MSSKPYDTKCAAEHPAPMPSEVRAAAVFVDALETA
jgi:hypothetical protein